jgi:AraC-like DNA-binding protein
MLDRAVALLWERHAEGLTLDDLGQAVGLTAFQLIGLFKRGTGLTPHAYLTQIRLRVATGLLQGGTGLAEAAVAAGFYDQSALQNHFKRAYGITPLQYLRVHQG